jgi:ribosomal protein L37E
VTTQTGRTCRACGTLPTWLMRGYCAACYHAARDSEERSVEWRSDTAQQTYGPGLTLAEVQNMNDKYLRSAYFRGGSGAYHYPQIHPLSSPGPLWRAAHEEVAS